MHIASGKAQLVTVAQIDSGPRRVTVADTAGMGWGQRGSSKYQSPGREEERPNWDQMSLQSNNTATWL